eukprot:TRINITY_DN4828_c0_g1_i4.p1 TRINITY_DN4828_c0_g1~~TRINITY_DN4828_c0_g1_i4.p1  ORF type:complete len:189 (-),score=-28.43 TRINITY_DN4828_c0_g1_i4:234-800(-)
MNYKLYTMLPLEIKKKKNIQMHSSQKNIIIKIEIIHSKSIEKNVTFFNLVIPLQYRLSINHFQNIFNSNVNINITIYRYRFRKKQEKSLKFQKKKISSTWCFLQKYFFLKNYKSNTATIKYSINKLLKTQLNYQYFIQNQTIIPQVITNNIYIHNIYCNIQYYQSTNKITFCHQVHQFDTFLWFYQQT